MSVARYIVRPKNGFWLLERKDTGRELALFDTRQKAVKRGEALARDTLPSLLEIHTGTHVEERRYPFPVRSSQDRALESLE